MTGYKINLTILVQILRFRVNQFTWLSGRQESYEMYLRLP